MVAHSFQCVPHNILFPLRQAVQGKRVVACSFPCLWQPEVSAVRTVAVQSLRGVFLFFFISFVFVSYLLRYLSIIFFFTPDAFSFIEEEYFVNILTYLLLTCVLISHYHSKQKVFPPGRFGAESLWTKNSCMVYAGHILMRHFCNKFTTCEHVI